MRLTLWGQILFAMAILYLDYNATTPLIPEVKEAITTSMELFGPLHLRHVLGNHSLRPA